MSFSLPVLPPRSTLFPYTTLFRSFTVRSLASDSGFRRSSAPMPVPSSIAMTRGRTVLPDDRISVNTCSRSEEHTSELQSHSDIVCRLMLEKKKHEREKLHAIDEAL